jgi:PAS domain S-box-containing protein
MTVRSGTKSADATAENGRGSIGDWRQLAFEESPMAMCLFDLDRGGFIEANRRMRELLDVQRGELDAAGAAELIGIAPGTEPVQGQVVVYRRRNGEARVAAASFEPVRVEGRAAVVGVFEDVTSERRALLRDEQRLRTLGAATNQIFFAIDPHRRPIIIPGLTDSDTHAWYTFTGQEPGSASGRGWVDMVHPDDVPLLRSTWTQANAGPGLFEAECRIRRADGEYRLMEIRAMPEMDETGRICEWLGTLTDITERREQQADITRVNLGLWLMAEVGALAGEDLDYDRTLQRLAGVMVPTFAHACILDLYEDGVMRRVAVRHRDPMQEAIIEGLRLAPPDAANPADVMTKVVESGEAQLIPNVSERDLTSTARSPGHLEALRALGVTSVIRVPLATSGPPFGAMAFVLVDGAYHYDERDLELGKELARRIALSIENARLYTDTRATEQQLREANRVKDEFLGMMSHELRTPITVVRGGAQVLHTRNATMTQAERDQLAQDIEHESTRLARMLDDLLALSRLELDQLPNLEPVLLERVIPAAIHDHTNPELASRLAVRMGEDLPIVYADAGYIGHILGNMLSNAEKYSPPHSVIDVVVDGSEDGVAVRVLDRGPGVPEADYAHLFERFFRSTGTSMLAGGAGLGLPVCQRLVEAMSGTIWAKPREGGGFEIGFTVPVAADASGVGEKT